MVDLAGTSTELRGTLSRYFGISVIWVCLMGGMLVYRGDPRAWLKVGLFAGAMVPAVFIQVGVVRMMGWKLATGVEAVLLPFVAFGVLYVVWVMRG